MEMRIMKMRKYWVTSVALLVAGAQVAMAAPPASGPARMGEKQAPDYRARMGEMPRAEEQGKLTAASEVYRSIARNAKGEVPRSVLDRARCIAVLPNVYAAAVVVGGSYGTGVASCRTSGGQWSKPAFIDLTSASVGAQLGAKSSDLVLYMLSADAENRLKNGTITLGADASVTAGNFDKNWDASPASIVAYQRSEGGMAGISINGFQIAKSDKMNTNYYGRDTTFSSIFQMRGDNVDDSATRSFISELPKSHV